MISRQLKNERGIAMVLAISLVALLSLLAIWLMLGTGSAFRITSAATRYEAAFNLAEGALQLSLRCLRVFSPVPSYSNIVTDATLPIQDERLPQYARGDGQEPMGKGAMVPRILYIDHNTNPPPGWMANPQGYYRFFSMYYQPRGKGEIQLSTAKGSANTAVAAIAVKVSRE
jgi:hypothetical protein